MKATPLAAFAAFVFAALCAFAPAPASAQRENVFAVSGIYVDETAANGAAAQQAGFAAAQRAGFERLVRRVTLPEELGRAGIPDVDNATLDRLVQTVDVNEERRSGTRYIGRLTVRFDPAGIRSLLQARQLRVVDTRTAPVLIVPAAIADVAPETAAAWRDVWANGGFDQELAPLVVAPAGLSGPPSWETAAPFAQSAAANSAIYATLRTQGNVATASLIELGPNGVRRDRGEVSAGLSGDANALRASLASLADQASQRVQNEWKARISGVGTQSNRVSAQALYQSERQWEQIKSGLEQAAATLISQIRIEAVGREGALVSFSFVGDRALLSTELSRHGVTLSDGAGGPVLRAAQR
ncbi:MAG: DUF2066 domain-containing protein [Hyphomonadaceae bacterium]|nr:DUF2066 domain-containing protein [Hyphomonadaceae bacterium]